MNASQGEALLEAVRQSRVSASLPNSGNFSFYLQLDADSSGSVFTDSADRGQSSARAAARSAKARIGTLQDALARALPAGSTALYRTSTSAAGLAISTDVSNYRSLFSLPGVKNVHAIAPKTLENAGVADLINVLRRIENRPAPRASSRTRMSSAATTSSATTTTPTPTTRRISPSRTYWTATATARTLPARQRATV